jgi:DNA helicase-2/ATP-dependent DNA helicase PcrA
MDVSDLIDPLNEPQRAAVTTAVPSRNLVLAGAGSGKTRVLTHRAAWLMRVEAAPAHAILAVTFTNKAANEMRGRIGELVGRAGGSIWAGTFHGIAHRLLRLHWREAGLVEGFQILDSEDQRRQVKRVLRSLDIDDNRYPPRQVQGYINGRKDEGLRPGDLDPDDAYTAKLVECYRAYEDACRTAGLVDFPELLLRVYELLRDEPGLLAHYRERFRHVLVDEFQDTNGIQYDWLTLLAGPEADVFVVGDDDQSIYGWRGARVDNLHRFQRDYPDTQVHRLEQNYRSTATILEAANALIDNNSERLGKTLWTDGGRGDPIAVYAAFNEQDEARFVVERLQQLTRDEGYARSDVAILYRSNAQSRTFEEALLSRGIPYRVYGGLRFFERAEIKDALAYLRLLANRQDDAAFERVVNNPPRGIGNKTIDGIRSAAREQGRSLWDTARVQVERNALGSRAGKAVARFIELIETLAQATDEQPLPERVERVLADTGLRDQIAGERSERARDRLENLDELVTAARTFEQSAEPPQEGDWLTAFLAHAALEAGEGQAGDWEDGVQLMTLHSAKGLEFPLVFLTGLEEGLFPHRNTIDEPERLEEERRLAYVGVTRAGERLFATRAERRRLHGRDDYAIASRFLHELPPHLLEELRARFSVTRPQAATEPAVSEAGPGFDLGQQVVHDKFGSGVVLAYEGEGASARIQVNFAEVGSKWLVAAYANLRPA